MEVILLKVVSWNISYMGDIYDKLIILKALISESKDSHPIIFALQEVTPKAYEVIVAENIFDNDAYSLNFREPGKFEGANRGLGCLIFVAGGLEIIDSSLIERMPFPERALSVKIKMNRDIFEVMCFHSLTGVGYKRAKSAQFASLADYLHLKRNDPLILCGDLNEPRIDHYDLDKLEFFDQQGDKGEKASYILRPEGVHNLQDSYRVMISQNKDEWAKIKDEQAQCENIESKPLAVSHILPRGIKKRYDYIMVSPHWEVIEAEYRYDDGIQYGSDHAIVVSDLKMNDR